MALLRDGVAARSSQSRFDGEKQFVQVTERRQRHLRGPDLDASAVDRIELPGRQDRHDTRSQLHVHKLSRCAPLALNATHAPPAQRMPAIMDNDILPDMGRMTVRW
jgi:hypothetical protein